MSGASAPRRSPVHCAPARQMAPTRFHGLPSQPPGHAALHPPQPGQWHMAPQRRQGRQRDAPPHHHPVVQRRGMRKVVWLAGHDGLEALLPVVAQLRVLRHAPAGGGGGPPPPGGGPPPPPPPPTPPRGAP